MAFLFGYYFLLSLLSLLFSKNFKLSNLLLFSFFTSLVLFVPYLFFNRGIRDIQLFESVGYFSLSRINIYYFDSTHQLYPYLPLLSIILGPVFAVSKTLGFNFLNLWRILLLISLMLISYFIEKILNIIKEKKIYSKLSLFIFSPLTLWPVMFHGHPDVILIMFYLISIWLFLSKQSLIFQAITFGFSILAKTWSVIFLPLILFEKSQISKKIIFLFITIVTILAAVLFYARFWHSPLRLIFQAVSNYSGSWNINWGPFGIVAAVLKNPRLFNNFKTFYTFLIFGFAYLIITWRRLPILRASEFLMLTFFVFTASWAPQYVFWVWPFVVLNEKVEKVRLFSLFAIPYVFFAYGSLVWNWNISLLIAISSLPIWFFGLTLWYNLAKSENLH